MPIGRSTVGLLAAATAAVLVAACTSSKASRATSSASSPPASNSVPSSAPSGVKASIVALGDSIPAGTACGCTPFPELSAAGLSVPDVRSVSMTNDAVSGFTSADVLRQVTTDQPAIDAWRGSEVAEIEVGANDIQFSKACETDVSCYEPALRPLEENLDAIVQHVRQLLAGPHVVVLLDYWSVWLGGQYAAEKGQAYVDAAITVTDAVDRTIQAVAARTGSTYVDLRLAFKGPSYSYDETHYLAGDGIHPNAAGHQQIAAALVSSIEGRLR